MCIKIIKIYFNEKYQHYFNTKVVLTQNKKIFYFRKSFFIFYIFRSYKSEFDKFINFKFFKRTKTIKIYFLNNNYYNYIE